MASRTATKSAAKAPDDQPFEFDLNAVESEVDLAPFRFLWKTADNPNRRFTMHHLAGLNVWDLMEAAEQGDMGATVGIFKAAMSDDDWKAFRGSAVAQYKMTALFKAYRKHCGTAEGESPASSDS
ncbi:hypothetical protein ABZX56_11235 [Streptomyces parvulus]|uniref:hypothetical protein n=1 Tax=Streptomyces parvulus TaxID=146923 RepID=UPI0033AD5779